MLTDNSRAYSTPNTLTIEDEKSLSIVGFADPKSTVIRDDDDFEIVKKPTVETFMDYQRQIWPLETQRREQRDFAERYDELCKDLQDRLNTEKKRADHNDRASAIRDRLRRKLDLIKKNQT